MKILIISLFYIFYSNGVIAQIDTLQFKKLCKGEVKSNDRNRYNQVFNSKWELLGHLMNDSVKLIDSAMKKEAFNIIKMDKKYFYVYKINTDTIFSNKFRIVLIEKRNKLTRFELHLYYGVLGKIDYKYTIINIQDDLMLVELTSITIDNVKQNCNIKFIYYML